MYSNANSFLAEQIIALYELLPNYFNSLNFQFYNISHKKAAHKEITLMKTIFVSLISLLNAVTIPFQSTFSGITTNSFTPINFTPIPSVSSSVNVGPYNVRSVFSDRLVFSRSNDGRSMLTSAYYQLSGPGRHSKSIAQLGRNPRAINGRGNNERNPEICMPETPLKRQNAVLYFDGQQVPIDSSYNPRQISNAIGKIGNQLVLNEDNVTMAFTIWGQFIDHDLSLTEVNESQTMDISIPKCDIFMDAQCSGDKTIPFKRSQHLHDSVPRNQMTSVTGWLDGSMVYGSTEQVAHRLRTFKDGKLKTSGNGFLPLLEGDPHKLPDAGDVRSAENLFLLSYHTIFMREHNRMCDMIISKNESMSDEQIYQASRSYVIALIQKITYQDFLPILLGRQGYWNILGSYKGYNQDIDSTISSQFSTVAYRFGHSLLVNKFPLIDRYDNVESQIQLSDTFFKHEQMQEQFMQKLLRGLAQTITKKRDGTLIDDVRNLLIMGPQNRQVHLDLYALNVQRARDHGLQKYNRLRQIMGLQPYQNFEQLTGEKIRSKIMADFYNNDINTVDPWVGVLNQKNMPGAILGELGSLIVGKTFKKLRDGDRYWYQRILPSSILSEIKVTVLSQILMRNTKILEFPQNLFFYKPLNSRTTISLENR